MIVDFHSHTLESDGTLSVSELVAAMRARGVEMFSITDHDTLSAYRSLGDTGGFAKILTGIEINTTYRGNEVHILGYRLPLEGESQLHELLEAKRRAREARIVMMVAQLRDVGIPLELDAVRAEAVGSDSLGRPHVGKALVRGGFVSSIEAAFRTLLARGKPGYVPSHHVTPQVAIAVIRRSGGIPVLAHPGRLNDYSIIDELAQAGLRGLEVFYPTHDPKQVDYFRKKAEHFKLVATAGSDFHDIRWNTGGVGVEIERREIAPFLDLAFA
jgi:predicted metal-dependent phosphoesterase TrpH